MLATANFVEFLFHALACIEVCSAYYRALCDSPEPFIKAEFTSRTPETRRRPSTRERSSSSRLPLPKTSSASSSPVEEPGRTTMRSRGTSEASISLLSSARDVSLRRTSLTRLASLRFGNKRCLTGLARTSSAKAKRVAEMAARNMPLPTASPTAATAQMLAAVVKPLTISLRKMIVPAPMKPMPLATCAATREGSRIICCSPQDIGEAEGGDHHEQGG